MALNNFIPTIWSTELNQALQNSLVYANVANRKYEGDIRNQGDTVKIQSFGDVAISSYTKNSTSVSAETLTDNSTILAIDQANYFAFQIDDVDKAQMNVDIMQSVMSNAAYKLADTADSYIAALYGQAGNDVGTSTTAIDINSANVVANILAVGEALNDNNVPLQGRWMIVPPWFVTKLILAGIAKETDNASTWQNGFVTFALGFNIYMSNNVSIGTPSTGAMTRVMAGSSEAIAYAQQISSVEAYRPEAKFADAIKGLHLYGAKVVKSNELVTLYADLTAEA